MKKRIRKVQLVKQKLFRIAFLFALVKLYYGLCKCIHCFNYKAVLFLFRSKLHIRVLVMMVASLQWLDMFFLVLRRFSSPHFMLCTTFFFQMETRRLNVFFSDTV